MSVPIQAAPPVNAIITIQPVTSQVPNRDAAANPLATVPPGTTVEGFVVNRDAQNNPILRTPLGDLQLTSDVFLKTGSEVVFRVDTSQSSLARILTVDGLSPQDYSAQSSHGLTEDTISATALQSPLASGAALAGKPGAPATAPLLQAIILQGQTAPNAALLASQSGQLSVLSQLAQLSAGTPIRLLLLDLKLPPLPVALANVPRSENLSALLPPRAGGVGLPTPENTQSAAPLAAHTSSERGPITLPPLTQGGAAEPAPAGGASPALIASHASAESAVVTPPEAHETAVPAPSPRSAISTNPAFPETPAAPPHSAATALPAARTVSTTTSPQHAEHAASLIQPKAPDQVIANVIGHDADGANILHTPFASLKLYTPQPLPTGTNLLVQVSTEPSAPEAATPLNAAAAPPITTPASGTSTQADIAVMDDALNWLQTNHPDVARDMQLRLPSISHKLASSLLSYISAVKTGDIGEIIGKRSARLLELGAPEIFAKLRQQASSMQINLVDSPSPHWLQVPLPMLLGQELQAAQLFISKDPPESAASPTPTQRGQRFVLEVDLSQLGPMQFDGFVRSRDTSKSFDLMVRSTAPLPEDVNQGIRTIFEDSTQITGLQGQVIFQHGRQHFIKPNAPAAPRTSGDGAHTILA